MAQFYKQHHFTDNCAICSAHWYQFSTCIQTMIAVDELKVSGRFASHSINSPPPVLGFASVVPDPIERGTHAAIDNSKPQCICNANSAALYLLRV